MKHQPSALDDGVHLGWKQDIGKYEMIGRHACRRGQRAKWLVTVSAVETLDLNLTRPGIGVVKPMTIGIAWVLLIHVSVPPNAIEYAYNVLDRLNIFLLL